MDIQKPTNIQRMAIPPITVNSSQDIIVKAQTGSGKTLAYLLPVVNRLMALEERKKLDRKTGTFCVVLAPTRELATQIYETLNKLLQYNVGNNIGFSHWIVPGIVIGGDKRKSEKARLRKGVHILVSTPGRLLDHLKHTGTFNCKHLRWIVLDEADRLLEMGFHDTLVEILDILGRKEEKSRLHGLPDRTQTILCSATIGSNVKELAERALTDPLFITEETSLGDKPDIGTVDNDDSNVAIPSQLKQEYTVIPTKLRLVSLITYLKTLPSNAKCIVYVSCCDSVEFHHKILSDAWKTPKEEKSDAKNTNNKEKPSAADKNTAQGKPLVNHALFKLHGSLTQQIRKSTVSEFTKSKSGILFCTDVAARGIDIPDISHIVQYDAPIDPKDYIHRAGRTARIGKEGHAIIFLHPSEVEYVGVLRKLGMDIDERKMDAILNTLLDKNDKGIKKKDVEVQKRATDIQIMIERFIMANKEVP
jgi:ATP-dependent RNA helicase DDX31/DBP7